MPSNVRWAYYKPRAWAVIGGVTVDLVGFQVDYPLNAIPTATLRLPLGRSVQTNVASAIHGIVQQLVEQTAVQVYCQFAPTLTSDGAIPALNIPTGVFKVFDGLTAGGSYTRNNAGTAQYSVICNHLLVRLNQASAFSDSSHPGNPARYSYGAITTEDAGAALAAAGAEALNWSPITQAHKYLTEANIAEDLWGKAIYPWFTALTKQNGMWIVEQGNVKGEKTNSQAAQALALLKPGGKWAVPLLFQDTLKVDVNLANQIANDIGMSTMSPGFVAQQTLWDILVGSFATDYVFAVVPRVSDALVVPFIPCTRGTKGVAFEKILASEYSGIGGDTASRRPLRAYGILSGLSTRAGSDLAGAAPPDGVMGVGGWYDTQKDGTVMIQSGPRWMNALAAPQVDASEASGANLQPVGNALNPGAGHANGAGAAAQKRAPVLKSFLNGYAKARYAQEVLHGRSLTITGAFRCDIAPGSMVEIEGASEAFIADQDQFGLPYFGDVLQVSLVVDAEVPMAGSALHIGYLRTAAEIGSDQSSIDGHPLYQKAFLGAPLLDS